LYQAQSWISNAGDRHRSNGIRASFSPKSVFQSSPICDGPGWVVRFYNSVATAEQQHKGRQNTPSAGRGYRAGSFRDNEVGCNCTPWPTTWHLLALQSRLSRGHGGLVVDQLTTEAERFGGPRRGGHARAITFTACPRWRSQGPHGQGHPQHANPPPSSASSCA